ncbi:hypothetical protein BD309DRAFT_974403 [Dichomitus squalens]|uniref:Uncharacterized protein n=1 Tax=Dichomitus squalens TaxID=114155 RepID=A0A4Q9MFS6_9APHY|nr:hypothetical protein BD311DRAFT_766180 [Dichomitus squalens]TBU37268.1 hypothetical protein BD309DRAFT_974403 [Dichomitus squalens]
MTGHNRGHNNNTVLILVAVKCHGAIPPLQWFTWFDLWDMRCMLRVHNRANDGREEYGCIARKRAPMF